MMRVWDPFREMEDLLRELHPALGGLVSGSQTGTGPVAFLPGRSAYAYPRINMGEDTENLYVEALAPGIRADALELTIERNTLTLGGEKVGPGPVPGEAFYANERSAGRFRRTIDLPVEVDADRVTARYVDGLLSVTLPKSEAAKPKHVQVAVS